MRPSSVSTTTANAAAVVRWTFDPWREHRLTAWAAAFALLGFCVLLIVLREPLLVTLGLALAGASAFAPALAASECLLDEQGAAVKGPWGWQRRPWTRIRRVERLAGGVLLSPYAQRHWLDTTRGLVLPAPRARVDELTLEANRVRERHDD